MRARSHVYHVDCFRCVACGRQLVPGDEFALADDGLLCRVDHDLAVEQLQCGGGGGGGGAVASLKSLALSPPDSVTSEDVGFTTAAAAAACNNNNNNNNNNGETTTNNSITGKVKLTEYIAVRINATCMNSHVVWDHTVLPATRQR